MIPTGILISKSPAAKFSPMARPAKAVANHPPQQSAAQARHKLAAAGLRAGRDGQKSAARPSHAPCL